MGSQDLRSEDDQTVDLARVLTVLRRRKWTIVACGLVALAITVVWGVLSVPMYRATAQIVRQTASLDQALFGTRVFSLSDQQRDLATASDMVRISAIAAAVKEELGSPWDIRHLQKMVSVSPVGQTNIIAITAKSPSPTEAAAVANSFARQFILYRQQADKKTLASAREQVAAQLAAMSPEELASERGKTLSQKVEELAVLESLQTGGFELIQEAEVPKEEYSPRLYRNSAIALVVGLAAGILLAFLIHTLDKRLRDEREVAEAFGVPVVATVPRIGSRWSARFRGNSALPVGFRNGAHATIESFRTLRSNLRFFEVDKKLRAVVVTSALPGEGKSVTSINLALSLVMSGARVVLLEGDLRKPTLHAYLGLKSSVGFSNLLAGTHTIPEAVQLVDARPLLPVEHQAPVEPGASAETWSLKSAPRFHFVSAGPLPPNPTELLGTARATDVIQKLVSACDYLIIDSPPLLAVSDALELAKRADAVLVVARLLSVTTDDARRVQEHLKKLGTPPIGVVVLGTERPRGRYKRYGDYYSRG